MSLSQSPPILYAITSGATTPQTTPEDAEFAAILHLVEAAVAARVSLFQIREKSLSTRVLYELTARAAGLTRRSGTRLLVNDRFDVARAAGADGVHLASLSLPVGVARSACGANFLIGASTHSLTEAREAANAGADFVVFGPVFEKQGYGQPQGLEKLKQIAAAMGEFPVIAIGGVTLGNAASCFAVGARGVAAIRLFNDAASLPSIVEKIVQ